MKNILFLGQKNIGEDSFKTLNEKAGKEYLIRGICSNTNTDVWWGSNNLYKAAHSLNIPFISNNKRNEDAILAMIHSESIDTIISAQHPWILSTNILQAVGYQALNLHNAKLPNYKGYNTINHAIINGEKDYTSTVHWMVEEVDQGAIAFEETVSISSHETAISLYKKSCIASMASFDKLVDFLKNNKEIPRHDIASTGHFYNKSDLDGLREIKNPNNPIEMDRKARGLFYPPYEPSFYKLHNKKIYVLPKGYKAYIDDVNQFLGQFKKNETEIEHVVLDK